MDLRAAIPSSENDHYRHPNHNSILRRLLRELLFTETCPPLAPPGRLPVYRRRTRSYFSIFSKVPTRCQPRPQTESESSLFSRHHTLPNYPGSTSTTCFFPLKCEMLTLNFQLIFHLMNGKLFSPTATATYNDINFGIASFMTCVEALIFSLIFQWAFSSSEYKEGEKLDRLGMGPARRTSTFKAIFDALNLSDIVNGTVVAFELLFVRVKSRYGASKVPQRQRTLGVEDQVHLEPLADRSIRDSSSPETSYGKP